MSRPIYANNVRYPSVADFLRAIGVPKPSQRIRSANIKAALADDGIFTYKGVTYVLRDHARRSIIPPVETREIVTIRRYNDPPILLKKHQTIGLHQDRGEHL